MCQNWLNLLPEFLCHATVKVLLLGIGGGSDTLQLLQHGADVAGEAVAVALCLSGGDTFLQLMGSTGLVALHQQSGQCKAVTAAELLLPLVLYGAAEQGGLSSRVVG